MHQKQSTCYFVIQNKHLHDIDLMMDSTLIERFGLQQPTKTFKFLGLNIYDKLSWADHIQSVRKKVNSGCLGLSSAKHFLIIKVRCNIYHSLILLHINYIILAVRCAKPKDLPILQTIQKKSVIHVSLAKAIAHTGPLLIELDLLDFYDTVLLKLSFFCT